MQALFIRWVSLVVVGLRGRVQPREWNVAACLWMRTTSFLKLLCQGYVKICVTYIGVCSCLLVHWNIVFSVVWYFSCHCGNFSNHVFLWVGSQELSSQLSKYGPFLRLNTSVVETLSWMIEIWMRGHYLISMIITTLWFYNAHKLEITYGLQLVLVILHGQFTISIERDKSYW